jgi:exosortase A
MSEFAPPDGSTRAGASNWRMTLVAVVSLSLALMLLFQDTVISMVDTWYQSETYTHGFVILPIAIWLAWQKRDHLVRYTPQSSYWMIAFVVLSLIGWSVARLVGVQVVEQASFVALLITAIVTLVGLQIAKLLVFPLFFLFFAVPMGEDLVPIMMEFTADFTVGALKLTGIPVYREGLWFSLPSGNWSVVEACSGVRYLIASATLGTMYAYITYHTLWKRLVFIALSVVVPILANGVRAYMIVMIGHLSDMRLATGVDHILYGWVFFGFVMFLLFWIGGFLREHHIPPGDAVPPARKTTSRAANNARFASALLIFGISATSAWAVERLAMSDATLNTPLALPVAANDWQLVPEEHPLWESRHPPTAESLSGIYRRQDVSVQVFVAFYPRQGQGMEAISSSNRLAENVVSRSSLPAVKGEGHLGRQDLVMIAAGDKDHTHVVSQWYQIADRSFVNRYQGKAYEAIARIYPGRSDGAWIAVTIPVRDPADVGEIQLLMTEFVSEFAPVLERAIDKSVGFSG